MPTFQTRQKHSVPPIRSKKEKDLDSQNTMKNKKKALEKKNKRKPRTTYRQFDLKDTEQFSLCDAMRLV